MSSEHLVCIPTPTSERVTSVPDPVPTIAAPPGHVAAIIRVLKTILGMHYIYMEAYEAYKSPQE